MPQAITLKLTTMTQGGDALGRDENGRVVFVPYGIAGEDVRVEIVGAKKEFARARLVEVRDGQSATVDQEFRQFHFFRRVEGAHIAGLERAYDRGVYVRIRVAQRTTAYSGDGEIMVFFSVKVPDIDAFTPGIIRGPDTRQEHLRPF